MKKFSMKAFLVFALGLVLFTSPVRAQEDVGGEEDKFSFGQVVSVSGQQVTVREYDFVKDADVEVVYDVTAETELGNLNALADLVAGDNIVLDFSDKDGRRVVATLVKEEPEVEGAVMEEEETMPVDDGEAPVDVNDEAIATDDTAVEVAPVDAPVQE